MSRTDMLMVVCYDVTDDKARRRVATVLEDHFVRVQRSVFEARMPPSRAHAVVERAATLLGPGDSLRVYAIGHAGRRHARAWGTPPLPEDQDFVLL